MRGRFISFEGSDGCGKTTQIALLAQKLKAAGHTVLTTREPGGTRLGEAIRHLLQTSPDGEGMLPESELLLFAASRAQLVREVIRPALDEGHIVIADRFLDSTTVYQGLGRELDPEAVRFINDFAIGTTRPDLTLLLDVDPTVAQERLVKRGQKRDRLEGEALSFFTAVREGYLALARQESNRIALVNAAAPTETVAAFIDNLLESRFHGIFSPRSL